MISKTIFNIGMLLLTLATIFFFLVLFFRPLLGLEPVFGSEQAKVTICHHTSSETNPWVRVVVSPNATSGHFENNGTPKAGHEGDVLLQGDVPCPTGVGADITPTATPSATPTATPSASTSTDKCPNWAGVQTVVPQGAVVNDKGLCADSESGSTTQPEVLATATELPATGFDQTWLLGIVGIGLILGGLALKPWKKFED